MLCFGGNWLVSGGVMLARRFGISSLVIGMTVVAYGTSTPELAASLAASGEHGELILGNVIGSNIANVGMIIGISAILVFIAVSRSTLRREVPIMIGASLLLVLLSIDGEVAGYDGIVLIGVLVAFTAYTFRGIRERSGGSAPPADGGRFYLKSGGMIAAGVALLGAGAWLAVENAVVLARAFGLSEMVIGTTVIAIGTSLPELVTSVVAIKRGHTDIGVGNIIGSNIYNILMIMGVASMIAAVPVAPGVFTEYGIMICFSLVVLAAAKTGGIGRWIGAGLVAAYAAYIVAALLA
ncbi:Ca2 /Na antiporter [Cenarchaeum symbiosum A]|uniref:Ca2 /Na antiporter n=1 Tax=Cenarchaeum symbiosum (strain A) TaxID=414004 RepID=A0RUT9_CENSY|nr:Ca2 /Na antiporter [Cenarchaeum symbiosum A]